MQSYAHTIRPKQFSILVVDDDPDFSDLLALYLEKIPHAEISVAHGFDEAVNKLSHRRFDLIVSDWTLDHGDAPEVFARVDRMIPVDAAKQPVLFMSSSDHLAAIHGLKPYSHFEPVSFILKRFGPPLISLLAENALSEDEEQDGPIRYGAFQNSLAEI